MPAMAPMVHLSHLDAYHLHHAVAEWLKHNTGHPAFKDVLVAALHLGQEVERNMATQIEGLRKQLVDEE